MKIKVIYYPIIVTPDNLVREIMIEASFKEKLSEVVSTLK
jgi:hypothetical protein